VPSSAYNLLKNTVDPFLHPIETVKNVGRLGLGTAEKLGISPTTGHEQYPEAVGQFFKDRYGGWDNFKKTLQEDPVGVVGDLSVLLTAGGSAVERLPGVIGEAGEAMRTVGEVSNPLNVGTSALKAAPKAAAAAVGNIGTGSGGEAIKGAFEAGREGGAGGTAFRANMRDPEIHQSGIVQQARKALGEVRMERAAEYQKGMAAVGQNQKVLTFDDIDKAVSQANRVKSFKGVNISPSTDAVRDKINKAIAWWRKLPPGDFHTPAGFDALKQYVGDIKDSLQFGTPERKVAEEIYGAIRGSIVKQEPNYANVMKDYEQASNLIDEVQKTLSLGKKATEDTALRKLLSTTRSNVHTNFGKRHELAAELGKRDPALLPSLAGQAMSTLTPQGLVGKALAGGGGYAALMGHPLALAGAPFTSPRLMGEAAHGIGRGVGAVEKAIPQQILDQLKRLDPKILNQVLLAISRGGQSASQ
jgi:hypothetical protein